MVLETYILNISTIIITLISVYIYERFFISTNNFVSDIIKDILESWITYIIKEITRKKKKFEFRGFWENIPNFIYFIITIIIFLPLAIKFGVDNLNPFLTGFLPNSWWILVIMVIIIFIILYALFKDFWYKDKKQQKERFN